MHKITYFKAYMLKNMCNFRAYFSILCALLTGFFEQKYHIWSKICTY